MLFKPVWNFQFHVLFTNKNIIHKFIKTKQFTKIIITENALNKIITDIFWDILVTRIKKEL